MPNKLLKNRSNMRADRLRFEANKWHEGISKYLICNIRLVISTFLYYSTICSFKIILIQHPNFNYISHSTLLSVKCIIYRICGRRTSAQDFEDQDDKWYICTCFPIADQTLRRNLSHVHDVKVNLTHLVQMNHWVAKENNSPPKKRTETFYNWFKTDFLSKTMVSSQVPPFSLLMLFTQDALGHGNVPMADLNRAVPIRADLKRSCCIPNQFSHVEE